IPPRSSPLSAPFPYTTLFRSLGGAGVGLAANAIADVSVLTGVAPAFLGDASGGVIAYETRSGGERLTGDLRWESDEPFSDASSRSEEHTSELQSRGHLVCRLL